MKSNPMRRREFITLFGGAAAAWPVVAGAQQQTMPVIGLLSGVSFDPRAGFAGRIEAIRRGLRETGFVEGRNLAIEYRSADGQSDRLPELAADLVRRQVTLIFAFGTHLPALAAKTATATIPIVFAYGGDPVRDRLVDSLNRPEANVTGAGRISSSLEPKRLEVICELVPRAKSIAFLMNSNFALASRAAQSDVTDLMIAAERIGRRIDLLDIATDQDVEPIFATIVQRRLDAVMVSSDTLMNGWRNQIVALAARHLIPAIYTNPEYVQAGGLISYGPDLYEHFRIAGTYAGRILKGEKPGDLPVQLPTRFELVINLKAARALGLEVPLTLQVAATEIIE
jgi:putative ABC transport system substrate-binding protein